MQPNKTTERTHRSLIYRPESSLRPNRPPNPPRSRRKNLPKFFRFSFRFAAAEDVDDVVVAVVSNGPLVSPAARGGPDGAVVEGVAVPDDGPVPLEAVF